MKYIRRYNNAKIKEIEGWKTTDKKSSVDILDTRNNRAICITFGKKPVITVYELLDFENFGRVLSKERFK